MATEVLIKELKQQLKSDILDYGWILYLAKSYAQDSGNQNITVTVFDSVVKLLSDGDAEIGDTHVVDGEGRFFPWPGNLDEHVLRIKQVIEQFGTKPGMWDGFWLSKSRKS